MVRLACGVEEGGVDVFGFKVGVVSKDFVVGRTVGEELEDVFDADAQSANTRFSTALAGLDGDSGQEGGIHDHIIP